MGMNYFYKKPDQSKINIGKSSFGWHFGLNIYPEIGIYTLEDWQKYWYSNNGHIVDEEDREISVDDMIDKITNRSTEQTYTPSEIAEFCVENHCEPGLNNLFAHKSVLIDLRKEKGFELFLPILVVAFRTEGTYDLMPRLLSEAEEYR